MFQNKCKALLVAALAIAAGSAVAARDDSKAAVHGDGTAAGSGVLVHFEFNAVQKHSATLLSHGGVALIQDDPTGAFGNFEIAGKVKCMKLTGDVAVVGLIITSGSGTAAGHVGEAFYVVASDNAALGVPDGYSNSGYTGTSTVDCNFSVAPFSNVIDGDIRVRQDN
jgi:hypothetical protein